LRKQLPKIVVFIIPGLNVKTERKKGGTED
jgi:hypothetical protein